MHQIYMHWKALRHVRKDIIDRLDRNETVDQGLLSLGYSGHFCEIAMSTLPPRADIQCRD